MTARLPPQRTGRRIRPQFPGFGKNESPRGKVAGRIRYLKYRWKLDGQTTLNQHEPTFLTAPIFKGGIEARCRSRYGPSRIYLNWLHSKGKLPQVTMVHPSKLGTVDISEAIVCGQGATNEARNVLEYEEDAVSIATGQRMRV